ncbi:MAG: NB-ARC domain-containing protein [Ktedonobacteraceae bacterium]|nr:NB-ARC domain-containing protein [Chloroflexota bacterium]
MSHSRGHGRCAVILTALQVEYQAVRTHLVDLCEKIHPLGTVYEQGQFSGESYVWDVGLVEIGAGNIFAAFEVERAISYFKPVLVLFVGIAGGLRDVQLGDIVAATKVYGYESGKVKKIFQTRPHIGQSTYRMEQRARAEARKQDWLQRLKEAPPLPPRVFVAPIAAGEKVMADTNAAIVRSLKANYTDALAVEMESIGFLLAVHANQRVEALIIRGISDLIDNKSEADAANFQEVAARHASAFAFQILAKLDDTALQQSELSVDTPQHPLAIEIAAAHALTPFHNLPQPDYTRFIGRCEELAWLHQRLTADHQARAMVITGLGGIGKSALALAIAHEYRQRYDELLPAERFDAIIWISAQEEVLTIQGREKSSLAPLRFRTLEDMYRTIAQTLAREDITRAAFDDQHYLVEKVLRAQRTLIIVDSLETITDERVKTFLRTLPAPTKCIVTSREWLEVADHLKLTGLSAEETQMLIDEEARVRDVKLSPEQQQLLFRCTGGLPLPIKLSVARLASEETFEQVLRWLGNASGDLPVYCVQGQVAMARTYDPRTWDLLLACSLFDQEAGVSREALGAVTRLAPYERDDGLTFLQRLSLLNRTRDDRLHMLPMVQGYMSSELVKAENGDALTGAWLQWLLQFTRQHGDRLDLHIDRVQTFSAEYATLLSAIRWYHTHACWEPLLCLAEGAWFYPYLIGLLGEARDILEAAIEAAQVLRDERREGQFLRRLALTFWVQGEYKQAWSRGLQRAEEIARAHGDRRELARVYHTHADILAQRGCIQEGEHLAEAMLKIGQDTDYVKLKALAVYRLSECASRKRQFGRALELLDQGENWCKEAGWLRCLAWNKYLRGVTLIQQKNMHAAEPFLRQSLEMATSWRERELMANNAYALAQVYVGTGHIQLAQGMTVQAIDLYERLGATKKMVAMEALLLPRL